MDFFILGHPRLNIKDTPLGNSCQGCCACCTKAGAPPFGDIDIINNLPNDLKNELLTYMDFVASGLIISRELLQMPCLWLDIEKHICKNYKYRPQICRDFQLGSNGCQQFIQLRIGVP